MSNKYNQELQTKTMEIDEIYAAFKLEATNNKFTKASQQRARKLSLDLSKKLKEFREISNNFTRGDVDDNAN
jgi:hypothetical protein